MNTRTITLGGPNEVAPAAGGRLVIRQGSHVEVIKPPTACVRLTVGERGERGTLTFGTVTRTTLCINGQRDRLAHLFQTLTGVNP